MLLSIIVFASQRSLFAALGLFGLTITIALLRRIALYRWSLMLLFTGVLLLAITAGEPAFNNTTPGTIAVMVDLSPSTRGATFRDSIALSRRIHQLLGDHRYQVYGFSDHTQRMDPQSALVEMPADSTVFSPPIADAVVLFSDGQFELPAYSPPTYPVIDPALGHPADVAMTDLAITGDRAVANVSGENSSRPIQWTGAVPIDSRSARFDKNQTITASLKPGDLWPENDSLSITPPPPVEVQRWWVGASPPQGWQSFSTLPVSESDYLSAGVIVLNNISADAISSQDQSNLSRYVRDLGGSLLIVGGDHAFAAGGYGGTALDALSPLSSSPPRPEMSWLLLIDGSGSMAGDPWKSETTAAVGLLPKLPENDTVDIGSFSDSVRWWSRNGSAKTTAKLSFPPVEVHPNGPTNLDSALTQLLNGCDGSSPTQLLLMTDADADLPNANRLSAEMVAKKIHLHLLALGHGSALPALQSIAKTTGGSVVEQPDPARWISSADELLRSALPRRFEHLKLNLIPGPGAVTAWNQTWLKSDAELLQNSSVAPMVARWQVGTGQVISMAYEADAATVTALANQIAQPPVDPRFTVSWHCGSKLRVTVNAADGDQYLNGQSITVQLLDGSSPVVIPQVAPGLYEISMRSPRAPVELIVRNARQLLRRFSVAGRYAPEFDRIGNDRSNLQQLADRTGGTVIQPGPVQPIDFHWPVRRRDLTSECAIAGFVCISAALLLNRRSTP